MQTIGNYLKSGREARNIRLSEVAHSTKISKWYLDCLEKDEFDKIPGGPYIKGYIASYASFIGIEEDEILKRYDSLQINNADEDEIQDHLPQYTNKQKLLGFSFGRKKILVLSMAVLILLAFGINYFFFQNQTHIVAQLPDAQDSKTQSAPSSKIKQGETRLAPNENSIQSAEINDFTKKVENKFQKKQETASDSHLTDLSKNNHLNPIKPGGESHLTHQDATGIESPAILLSETEGEGALRASLLKENDIRTKNTTDKEPVIDDVPPSSQNKTIKLAAQADSKNTSHQGTKPSANLYPGSAPMYRTPDAQSQAANNMRVIKAVATSDITNRNPEESSNSFQWSTEKVYIWSMIECERPPSSIRHTYYFKGQKVNDIVLDIKSPQWRTWSYKTLLDKRYVGQWKVDITSIEGELLQSIFFDVN